MAVCKIKSRRGTVSYIVRLRDRYGNWFPSKSYRRKVDAENYERSLLCERQDGSVAETISNRSNSFAEYVEHWKKDCRGRVSDGWKIKQDQMLRDHVLPMLGPFKIGEMTPPMIGDVMRAMDKKGLGPQMRRHVYNMLHHIFDAACSYHQWIQWNPVSKKDRPFVPVVERLVLNPDQVRRLLNGSRDHYVGPAIWIGALAGLRPNEIQGLRWGAVDFDKNVIKIVAGFKRGTRVLEPYPKQKKHGSSPMIPVLREYLMTRSHGKSPTEFVIPGIKTEILDHGTFYKHLRKLCAELSLPVVSPHALRHSCTEIWCEFGASEEDIVRLLNQSGAGSVRRYIHKTPERLMRIANGVDFKVGQPQLRIV